MVINDPGVTAAGVVAAGWIPDAAMVLQSFGAWVLAGIALIVFVESGVLFPFLPGDSLLVTAAILTTPLGIAWWQIAVVGVLAAIAGDQVGYVLGRRAGRRLFREEARVLRTSRLERAEDFFGRRGGAPLVAGRFIPVLRTYVPLAAGTARMPYRRFVAWNAAGAVLWVASMTTIGVVLGDVPVVVDNIDALTVAIIVISLAPILVGATRRTLRARRTSKQVES